MTEKIIQAGHRPLYLFYRHILSAAFAAAVCLFLYGCPKHAAAPAIPSGLFWPGMPEPKRIEFIHAFSNPEDLDIRPGLLKRLTNYITGSPAASMVSPYGIATDSEGRVYVVDVFLKRVHVFDPARNYYHWFPEEGTPFASPVDIAIDKSGVVFITDSKKGLVYLFEDHGKRFLSTVGEGIFKRPTGIAVNQKKSELLVVDTLLSRVFRFDLPSLEPKGSFGTAGAEDGMFHYPTNVFVTSTGDIVVSDALNFRVQVFSTEGRFQLAIGGMGDVPGTFSRPKGVAVDSDGNIYVVDALFDNVQVFDKRGRLLMAFGEHGKGVGNFWLPTGIYIDSSDVIYVSDSSNRRVQVFRYLKVEMNK